MAVKGRRDATKLLRLNMIVEVLNRKTPYGGVTIAELAERFEVSERQIRRDLGNCSTIRLRKYKKSFPTGQLSYRLKYAGFRK